MYIYVRVGMLVAFVCALACVRVYVLIYPTPHQRTNVAQGRF